MKQTTAILVLSLAILHPCLAGAGAKEELQGVRRELKEKNQLLKKTRQTETKVSGELEKIQRTLQEKEQHLLALGRELQVVERGIDRTLGEIDQVQGETQKKRVQINRRLSALYKAGEVGSLRIFFSSESFPQMTENMRYMRGVLDNDRRLFQGYQENLEELRKLKGTLEKDAARKEGLKRNMEVRKQEVEQEKAKKANYLVKVRQDKVAYQASIKELQANAGRLQAMIALLEARKRKAEEVRRKKAAEEAKRKALEAKKGKAYSTSRNSGSKGTHGSAPPEEKAAIRVPDNGLGGLRGRLSLPANGTVTGRFGRHKHPEFNSYTVSNGISIAASPGTPIRAVSEGEVIYAGYFKGYGNMVIVDHGAGFFSLYAHASSIAKRVGAQVSKNEVVASVGDLDSPRGPMLYFEIRYQGKPVDPSPWFR